MCMADLPPDSVRNMAQLLASNAEGLPSGQVTPEAAWRTFSNLEATIERSTVAVIHQAATHLLLELGRAWPRAAVSPTADELRSRALSHAERALAGLPPGSASAGTVLMNRALVRLDAWFDNDSSIASLEQAYKDGLEAVSIGHPEPDIQLRWVSNTVAVASDLGWRTQDEGVLDAGISMATTALSEAPPGQDRLVVRFNLSEILMTSFRLTGDVEQLDASLEASQQALAEAKGTRWFAHVAEAHASSLADRHRVLGAAEDLDQSIAGGRELLGRTADPARLARNLSQRLARRFDYGLDPQDLFEAEQLARTAAEQSRGAGTMNVGRAAIWIGQVTNICTKLSVYHLAPAALAEAIALLEATARHPDRSSLAYGTSRLIDATLSTQWEQPGLDRQRKLTLALEAMDSSSQTSAAWVDHGAWLVMATVADGGVIHRASLDDEATFDQLTALMTAVVSHPASVLAHFDAACRLLEATVGYDRPSRRSLAVAVSTAVRRWLALGVGADQTDFAAERLAHLGPLCVEAMIGLPDERPVEQSDDTLADSSGDWERDLLDAALTADALRSHWLDRLAYPSALAGLTQANPALATAWQDHLKQLSAAQQPRMSAPEASTKTAALLAERRSLLRRIQQHEPRFLRFDSDEAADRLLTLSKSRPVCVLSSSPDLLRIIALRDGAIESAALETDWSPLLQLLRMAQIGPRRFGRFNPYEDAAAGLSSFLSAPAAVMASLFEGVPNTAPVAVVADGIARSLPWPAAPTGPGRHLIDDLWWVNEPSFDLVATSPTPVPTNVVVIDGDLGVTLPAVTAETAWVASLPQSQLVAVASAADLGGLDLAGRFLHIAAHGLTEGTDLRQSGLSLRQPDGSAFMLRASDLVEADAVPAMAILSACSLGHAGLSWGANAFAAPVSDTLRAIGVGSVASYLFPCNDRLAALFSIRVHQIIASSPGLSLASAVRRAQMWAKYSSDGEVEEWLGSCPAPVREVDIGRLRRTAVWGALTVSGW